MGPLPKRSGDVLPGIERRIVVTMAVFSLIFLLLLFYFWRLQVLDHSLYLRLSDNNRIRLIDMAATRGIVTDRNGVILADSTPNYALALIPEDMGIDREAEIVSLADLLGRDGAQAVELFEKNATHAPYSAVRVFEHLGPEEVALFEVNQDDFPGSRLMVVPRRYYPYGKIAAHIFGYVGEISREQLDSGEYPGTRKGDTVGKYALEKAYDQYLRGKDGGRQVEVNARGRELNILGATEPSPGANVTLTLDIRLQKALELELWEVRGAGVLMNVQTGEILAMVSRPAFDPNEFSLRLTSERWNEIVRDPGHPMQSRAIQGMYPPGSTFKVVTAIAALMEKSMDPDEPLFCSGGYRFGRRTYRDWKLGGHGNVDLYKGIVESCDVYFYQAGERTGIDALARWASVLGLGRKTGIDLPGEKEGLVPSPDWKKRVRGEVWFPGETLSAAIGQGYVLVTPLQLTSLYGTIARRGTHMDPYLVSRVEDVAGNELYRRDPAVKHESDIPDEVFDRIISGLAGVVAEDSGTARFARWAGVPVAGKTGTAQVVRLQELPEGEEEFPYELRDHGWFAAFAPVNKPKIVAAVVVEHGGHGSSSAAPIVTRLIKKYGELYPLEEPAPDLLEETP
ncbi:MAG: penicillin-binding protein 2 [bacterium]|nr:penicillin-binding protein 2 [bacterium]MDT8365086.1 penicillin-binding protein 2 [bacterium]